VGGASYEFGKWQAAVNASTIATEEAVAALNIAKKTGCEVAISTCENHLEKVVHVADGLKAEMRAAAAKRGLIAGAAGACIGGVLAVLTNATPAH
jgi:hypothetical protein